MLGISLEAVRKRIERGKLDSEKDADGRVYVWLDTGETEPEVEDSGPSAVIDAKDQTIAVLLAQLEAERDAHREARRIIAGLVQRIPELEAPASDPTRHAPARETTAEGSNPKEDSKGAEPATEREQEEHRPWWRRLFGV